MPDSACLFPLIKPANRGTLDCEAIAGCMRERNPAQVAMTGAGSGVRQLDLLRALTALLVFDLVLSLGGFGKLYRLVKRWPVRRKAANAERIRRVCDAVDRAGVIYPRHSLCLQRSAVAACLLRSEGLDARMVIGCRKLPFMGHAWVEVDGQVVNDSIAVQHLYARLDWC